MFDILSGAFDQPHSQRRAGGCRRKTLDDIMALNEEHRRLIRDYVNYYHADRIRDSFLHQERICQTFPLQWLTRL